MERATAAALRHARPMAARPTRITPTTPMRPPIRMPRAHRAHPHTTHATRPSPPSNRARPRAQVLDFSLLLISIGALASDVIPALAFLKSLRALRVLRPLRLLSRNPGMRLIIASLIEALPAVSNVFGVLLALQLVFAILGMQIFMGNFGSCSDPTRLSRHDCVGIATADPPADTQAPFASPLQVVGAVNVNGDRTADAQAPFAPPSLSTGASRAATRARPPPPSGNGGPRRS